MPTPQQGPRQRSNDSTPRRNAEWVVNSPAAETDLTPILSSLSDLQSAMSACPQYMINRKQVEYWKMLYYRMINAQGLIYDLIRSLNGNGGRKT